MTQPALKKVRYKIFREMKRIICGSYCIRIKDGYFQVLIDRYGWIRIMNLNKVTK